MSFELQTKSRQDEHHMVKLLAWKVLYLFPLFQCFKFVLTVCIIQLSQTVPLGIQLELGVVLFIYF